MSRRIFTPGILLLPVLLLGQAGAAFGANCEWSGKGPDNRWSTAANWAACNNAAPKNGDSLIFQRTSDRMASENDIAALSLTNLTFWEPANAPYDISGLPLQVTTTIRLRDEPQVGHEVILRLPIAIGGGTITLDTPELRLSMRGPLTGAGIFLTGRGTLALFNASNDWTALQATDATILLAGPGALPARDVRLVGAATLDLNDLNASIRRLVGDSNASASIRLGTGILTVEQADAAAFTGIISGRGGLVKNGPGRLVLRRSLTAPGPNTYTGPTIVNAGALSCAHDDNTVCIPGPLVVNGGAAEMTGDHEIADSARVTVNAPGRFALAGFRDAIGSLAGNGRVSLGAGPGVLSIGGDNTSTTFAGTFDAFPSMPGMELLNKIGTGMLTLTGDSTVPIVFAIRGGTLAVDGRLNLTGVTLDGGALSGAGSVHADELMATSGVVDVTLRASAPGARAPQIDLTTAFHLSPATRLSVRRGSFAPPRGATFTIIDVAGNGLGDGTFQDLPEGATLMVEGQPFTISYRGGDGNDVVLTAAADAPLPTYFLSEGATGGFFDEDISIANPHDTPARVTLTFSKESGEQVVAMRTVPAKSRLTVDVESIPGLEATSASAQVRSDDRLTLVVERTMFWQASHYAGHTGGAVSEPAPEWFFAEGSQGFFSTFVLVINPNATPADVAFTFFRENEPTVTKTMTLGASARLTLSAGDVPELVDRSFGIVVRATQPIMAERSMYFGTTPTRFWSGGHASAGVTSASTEWFLAEGATGGFFDTFILLSNPQNTPAQVTLRYLLDNGDTVTMPKTIAANARLTTNIEAEEDTRLHNAAVSTVVTSDVPIIAERSMYWPGAAQPWGEAHNSFGVVRASTAWGLAEGRVGGPLRFQTYILLANPQKDSAQVTVTFLREGGEPVVRTYTVPPTSRFNVDASTVAELANASFGAVITVDNDVPIIVERSMYWDVDGILFSGGTNATAIALGDVP